MSLTFVDGGTFPSGLQVLNVGASGIFEQQQLGPIALTSLNVQAGGTLRSGDNPSATKVYQVSVSATTMTIAGSVSASGRGAPASSGSGFAGGGAGYGGLAGSDRGALYGSVTAPVDLGSGASGKGGGAIKLVASDSLTINGSVSADAGSIPGCGAGGAGGSVWLVTKALAGTGSVSAKASLGACANGVSGGGGRIAVHYETATGTLLDPGKLLATSPTAADSGPGAPGTVLVRKLGTPDRDTLVLDNAGVTGSRSRLTSNSESYASLTLRSGVRLELFSGQTLTLASDGVVTGHVGGSPRPTLTVDSGAVLALPATTALDSLDLAMNGELRQLRALSVKNGKVTYNPAVANVFGQLVLDSAGTFEKSGTGQVVVEGPLVVKSGGVLTHSANTTAQAHTLDVKAISVDVQSGGKISADALGFASSEGAGQGGDAAQGGGGGHGNVGGRGGSNTVVGGAGGTAYPDATALLGSGGGDDTEVAGQQGGAGGGSIALQVCGDLIVSGSISANGQNGTANEGGGGAGGSIRLASATLAGSGSITANGGNGAGSATASGGGGGGGRLTLSTQTNNFAGTIASTFGSKVGGTNAQNGAATTSSVAGNGSGDLCPEYACPTGACSGAWDPLLATCTFAATNGLGCDDLNLCTSGETCASGVCGGGQTVSCDDGIVCTTDTCSPQTGCAHPNAPSSTACDDQNPCTANDHCSAGSCVSGGATSCDDGDACTADACAPETGCTHVAKTCTALDQCHDVGTCNPQSGVCSNPAKPDGASCDDHSACSADDQCQAGACRGAALSCDDGNACSLDSCSPQTGCAHAPRYPTIAPAVPAVTLLDAASATIDLGAHQRDCQGGLGEGALTWSIEGVDPSLLTAVIDPLTGLLELTPVDATSTWSLTLTLVLTDAFGGEDRQALAVTHDATPFVLTLTSDPGTLVADGTATAVVTARLESPIGLAVGARKISFAVTTGPGRVVSGSAFTDPSGVATTELVA
ncbi:MAG: hypothetical protein U1F43_18460, partial [Myxococcota bacterium]